MAKIRQVERSTGGESGRVIGLEDGEKKDGGRNQQESTLPGLRCSCAAQCSLGLMATTPESWGDPEV